MDRSCPGGLVDPLDSDAVVPVITEVVDILGRPGGGLVEQLFQGDLLRARGAVIEFLRIGLAPTGITPRNSLRWVSVQLMTA